DLALDVKKQGKKLPWGLIFIGGAFLVAIVLFVLWKFKGEGGEKLDEGINLRGKDKDTLMNHFGYGKGKDQVEPGRPFRQEP
ncbi:unnamed protein product, partial [marine sediment metagenome]